MMQAYLKQQLNQQNGEIDQSQPQVLVTIEWKSREDGIKPENTIVTNSIAKKQCAELLVDFYESRINVNYNTKSTGQKNEDTPENAINDDK